MAANNPVRVMQLSICREEYRKPKVSCQSIPDHVATVDASMPLEVLGNGLCADIVHG